jgi:hypothetical protein
MREADPLISMRRDLLRLPLDSWTGLTPHPQALDTKPSSPEARHEAQSRCIPKDKAFGRGRNEKILLVMIEFSYYRSKHAAGSGTFA